MLTSLVSSLYQQESFPSVLLSRSVTLTYYVSPGTRPDSDTALLLMNDGQDLETMDFASILEQQRKRSSMHPLLCVAIHAGPDRKMEYGTASQPDYMGRGARAAHYRDFVLTELLPHVHQRFQVKKFSEMAFAGFSLGGLSALDIVWHHPHLFSKVGVFSGSLWWRQKSYEDGYDNDQDRIMHQLIRKGRASEVLNFFFQCGLLDETADRNKNGIIDSVEDTLDLMQELKAKGYNDSQIAYHEMHDGKHDVPTWTRAMPHFLKWGWSC